MKQYLDMLQHILDNGTQKGDRTGTGTISCFGYQNRYDLSQGFPLVTTKKTHLKSIIHELLWFINGDTNIKYLSENGVRIWDAWADEQGDLGPVYGHNWRAWGKLPERIAQPKPKLRSGLEATYLDIANGRGKENHPLGKTWEGMIARCYDKKSISYHLYGGRGVFVDNGWLEFSKFAEDAEKLAGWDEKISSDKRYVLDKDIKSHGFKYGADTCCWVTDQENSLAKSEKLYVVERDGIEYKFTNPSKFCAEMEISDKNFSDLWTGRKNAKVRYGFRLVEVIDLNEGIDQLKWLINEIKTNPNSRRLIISSWNVDMLELMALPPCHTLFHFYVADGKLSCQLYQRSADVFLGVPFNIASYALFTMMIAKVCGLEAGEFIHTFGDLHIYNNHIEQVKLQLTREPYPLPKMIIKDRGQSIFDFEYEDFELVDYESHPIIKGAVSV
jgi:thymidylate synthase